MLASWMETERLFGDFLWMEDGEKRSLHYVPWDALKAPKARGGLGVPNADKRNIALLWQSGYLSHLNAMPHGWIAQVYGLWRRD